MVESVQIKNVYSSSGSSLVAHERKIGFNKKLLLRYFLQSAYCSIEIVIYPKSGVNI